MSFNKSKISGFFLGGKQKVVNPILQKLAYSVKELLNVSISLVNLLVKKQIQKVVFAMP